MVDEQLQIMFHIDLVPNLSILREKSEGGMSIRMSEGVGRVMEEPNERYSKVKRIIILPALVELKGFKARPRVCYVRKVRVRRVAVHCQWMRAVRVIVLSGVAVLRPAL